MITTLKVEKIELNERKQHTKFQRDPIKIEKVMRVQSLQKKGKYVKKFQKLVFFLYNFFVSQKL